MNYASAGLAVCGLLWNIVFASAAGAAEQRFNVSMQLVEPMTATLLSAVNDDDTVADNGSLAGHVALLTASGEPGTQITVSVIENHVYLVDVTSPERDRVPVEELLLGGNVSKNGHATFSRAGNLDTISIDTRMQQAQKDNNNVRYSGSATVRLVF